MDTLFFTKMKQLLRMENTERCVFAGTGKYDIPVILPETEIRIDKLEWIPVNYAMSVTDRGGKGIYFYKDDYQFERFWNNPEKYLPLLREFGAVCSPDFSLYNDMPLAVQIFEHYKKHWLGAFWQSNGIRVIPTIRWCGESSYDWCFDGEPRGGIISISSHGTQSDQYEAECFAKHCRVALDRLKPVSILWYGKCPAEFDWNVVKIKPFEFERRKTKCPKVEAEIITNAEEKPARTELSQVDNRERSKHDISKGEDGIEDITIRKS